MKLFVSDKAMPCPPVKKLLMIMKLTAFIIIVTALHVSANTFSQKVSIKGDNLTLQSVFKSIRKQTGFQFVYTKETLEKSKPVSLNLLNTELVDVLNICLKEQRLSYEIKNNIIVITTPLTEDLNRRLISHDLNRQDNPPVTGRVTDTDGNPVAGVSVTIKGTKTGTTSDINGFFSTNAEVGQTLIFSSVEVETKEVKIVQETNLIIRLTRKVSALNEVVINKGYYTERQKLATGSVSRVTTEVIEKQPVSNVLQALQGRMPGVYIQQSTGVPGGGFNVQVRGRNSLRTGSDGGTNGNLPFYVIDGVPFTSSSITSPMASGTLLSGGNPLSAISPTDIESIEVLKDADATAIYGSRGANGVILITTKRSRAGKTKVDADVSLGAGKVAHFLDLLDTKSYLEMRNEAYKNDGATPDEYSAPDLLVWDTTRYTDWQKELIGGTAHTTNAQLSVSGGNANTQFVLGGGYYKEGSVFPGDNAFQRASGKLNINHQSLNKRFRATALVNYSSTETNLPVTDFTYLAVSLAPNAPKLYDADGNLNWENSTWTNPLASTLVKYEGNIDNLIASTSLSYEIAEGLNLRTALGYTTMQVNENSRTPITSYDPAYLSYGITGSSLFGKNSLKTWNIEPQADYSRKIGNGVFSALIGATFQQTVQDGGTIQGYGYANDALLSNVGAATTLESYENSYSEYRYAAAFARLNYSWKEKYILNLTGRRDGSSRFGPGKQFADFGAAGAAWIFSEEPFVANHVSFLSFGKLRSSYGTTGSDAIDNYQFLQSYASTRFPYAGTGGLTLARLANPNYSWEVNKKFEAAIELGFLRDRLLFSAAFYSNRSGNQLVGQPLPLLTGQSSVQFNFPATVQNKGWEFMLSTTNIKTTQLEWVTNLNFTLPQNKLVEFPGIENYPEYANTYEVGKSIYTYKGYQFTGVDPQTGFYTYADLNKDGVISYPTDYIALRKRGQTFFGGLANKIRYKTLQLDFFFQYVRQNGNDYRLSFGIPGTQTNQPSVVKDRWQQKNDHASVQQFTATDPTGEASTGYYSLFASDRLITDASFLRLNNVSLSWQIPKTWLAKATISAAEIYVRGQNLFTVTKYVGLDPETQNSSTIPPLRIITAGIHLTF